MAPNGPPAAAGAAEKAEALGIRRLERHIFLCADAATPRCCAPSASSASWLYLKRRLEELRLANGPAGGRVARTKAGCLRICADGPVAVVWPDGVWYSRMDPEGLEEVIERHLIGGVPVEERRIPGTAREIPTEPA